MADEGKGLVGLVIGGVPVQIEFDPNPAQRGDTVTVKVTFGEVSTEAGATLYMTYFFTAKDMLTSPPPPTEPVAFEATKVEFDLHLNEASEPGSIWILANIESGSGFGVLHVKK